MDQSPDLNAGARISVPTVALADGSTIPQLGFGVWQIPDRQARTAVTQALEVGYRLIDTAAIYGNEAGVGRALVAAADRGIERDDLYVTTKVWNSDQGYDPTLRAFDTSMAKLGLDVLDLYLIHWPVPEQDRYAETWKALVTLQQQGRVRSIGVSNFQDAQLTRIISETGVTPVVNQIELHPYRQQKALREFNTRHGIATEAYSPLGSGNGLLADPVLLEVAGRNGVSPAQAVLAWHLALGHVAIPKTVTPSRIVENLVAATVELPAEDLAEINGLDRASDV